MRSQVSPLLSESMPVQNNIMSDGSPSRADAVLGDLPNLDLQEQIGGGPQAALQPDGVSHVDAHTGHGLILRTSPLLVLDARLATTAGLVGVP